MTDAFIRLSRKFFFHHFWGEDRAFSRAEAWLDLVQSAAFVATKRMISGHSVDVPRGCVVASVRYLSDRWKWSNSKVCLFLDTLKEEGMIKTEKRRGITMISLRNFDQYNSEKRQKSDGEAMAIFDQNGGLGENGATEKRRENDGIYEGESHLGEEKKRRKSDTETTARRQRGDEYKELENSIERGSERPTWEQVQSYALNHIMLAEWKARDWFDEMEGCGWLDHNSRPISNWQAVMRRVQTKWVADGRPSGPPVAASGQHSKPQKPKSKFATW